MKGSQIKNLRKRLRWSQQKLAEYLNYGKGGRGTVSNIERGTYGIGGSALKLLHLAKRFGKDVLKLWDKRYEKQIKEALKGEPDGQD